MLEQAFADVTRRDPDNRVIPGVIGGGSSKQLNADHPFFETFKASGDSLFDDIFQELSAAMAASKGRSLNYFFQVSLEESEIFLAFNELYGSLAIMNIRGRLHRKTSAPQF
jgi:hypothetical protein